MKLLKSLIGKNNSDKKDKVKKMKNLNKILKKSFKVSVAKK